MVRGVCTCIGLIRLLFNLVVSAYDVFFFFSSRRRHTRSLCDWSSDVCSSDLELIGREAPLRDVTNLVVAHRLVTLTGAGGVGKTRLALEATRQLLPRFLDGAWLAELGSLADADLVPVAAAAALGLSFGAGPVTTDRVAVALRAKHLLLVIDNCEHVIEVAAAMAEAVLRASPLTRVLATSRESLRATEEYVYRVPSLDVPVDDTVDVEDVSRHGAVRLFNVRATAAEPGDE